MKVKQAEPQHADKMNQEVDSGKDMIHIEMSDLLRWMRGSLAGW